MLHSDLPQVHQDYIRERITIREASHHACTSNASLKELECTLSQNNKRLESLHLKNRYRAPCKFTLDSLPKLITPNFARYPYDEYAQIYLLIDASIDAIILP
ncbi:MAG: hypothetical protein R3Y56_10585 [Akkermansia sp.]